ncbi:MAG: hypothetical protein J7M38_12595 [Armatimonadetes bacterium]|nr:hypothetical protein [Armatimonadota bacterium]
MKGSGAGRHGRTERMLAEGFHLLVSLPRNDIELARAALEAGADGLKVHIGLHHHASGLVTGPLDEEADRIAAIVELGLPVGIVPGAGEGLATRGDMLRLAELGVDFFDLYSEDMPAWMLRMDDCPMSVMVAFSARTSPWGLVERVAGGSRPSMIEASVMPHESYGEPLVAADISLYAEIAHRSGLPVVVPTQKAVRPEEVAVLADAGVAALLIGAVVTGTEPAGLAEATGRFRKAVDMLS